TEIQELERSNEVETVLDGQHGGVVVEVQGGYASNGLDQLTIQNGMPDTKHGAITCSGSTSFLTNITVADNTGTGIYLDHGGASIRDAIITRNTGGGIFASSSNLALRNSNVTENTGALDGGGV